MSKTPAELARDLAAKLVNDEAAIQVRMWADTDGKRPSGNRELMHAGIAHLQALDMKLDGFDWAFQAPPDIYPVGWSGFRDYDSNVANLVVAAAFIQSEIAARILNGESTYRAPRSKTDIYTAIQPAMSSEEASKSNG
jgi:hypothetical protein